MVFWVTVYVEGLLAFITKQ